MVNGKWKLLSVGYTKIIIYKRDECSTRNKGQKTGIT